MLKRLWILLLSLQFIFIRWAKSNPEWVEINYSQTIYPFTSNFLRKLTGWIPFSIGDILYIILAISILSFLWRKVRTRKASWDVTINKAGWLVCIAYFWFHAIWGMNYYRQPLHKVLGLNHKYSTEELEKVVEKLTEISNKQHRIIVSNDSIKVNTPYTNEEIFNKTVPSYKALQKTFLTLDYSTKSIKHSIFSKPLIYMGFSGYINPFTVEAQVSSLLLPYKMPTTSGHEEAHQLGFAKENEANFIGALACMHSEDPYFKFSGYTFALRYCVHDLYRRDQQKGICAIEKINKGIRLNWQEVREFWDRYENPTEPLFKAFYNQFLKANNQSKGIKTYSYVVALFVNYFNA